jgi:hypothetical protein
LAACALDPDPALYAADRAVVVASPLAAPRLSFFHAALLVPPLQTAATLTAGTGAIRLGSDHSFSRSERSVDGIPNRFDGGFHDWIAPELRLGVTSGLEIAARTAVSGWDEHLDHFSLFDHDGAFLVRDESNLANGKASQRHENVASLDLSAKVRLLADDAGTATTSLALASRLPIAREGDLTNAGTEEVAATALETLRLGDVTLHANAGYVVPFGHQTLFTPGEPIELDAFAQGGVGAALAIEPQCALVLQVEANGSAFDDVPFLHRAPLTAVAGVRYAGTRTFVEAGVGAGLDQDAAYRFEVHVSFSWLL